MKVNFYPRRQDFRGGFTTVSRKSFWQLQLAVRQHKTAPALFCTTVRGPRARSSLASSGNARKKNLPGLLFGSSKPCGQTWCFSLDRVPFPFACHQTYISGMRAHLCVPVCACAWPCVHIFYVLMKWELHMRQVTISKLTQQWQKNKPEAQGRSSRWGEEDRQTRQKRANASPD